MSATAVSLSNMRNGYTIVTHVIPPPTSTEPGQMIYTVDPLQKFLKGKPKLLGSVQITIGLLKVVLGIVMMANSFHELFAVFGGIAFGFAWMYIITGSLAVSASINLHHCVVRGALVMNVISTITAAINFAVLLVFLVLELQCRTSIYPCPESPIIELVVVLVICSIIQFIISICVSVFACKAACSDEPSVNITVAPNQAGRPDYPSEQYPLNAVSDASMKSPPMESPPSYSEIKDN
ncbi:membrane-spanning 4-domains subfamily A member 4D-like isoform X1 [Colossoma macropomum]|uniref:membrane-spanning 4-domains subfamily A member 4D-like isoform X1 n=1 Tax=Colossoma macropomum TaxID=42526 RepID=UPI0018651A49|nr:membrane-spanning 4-domains subfamily A member 4D-like isoform X1 [Colossoma macropomum]